MLYSKKSENLITEKEKTTTNSRKIKPQLPITTSLAEILLNNNEKLVGTITSDQYLNKDNKQVPLYKLIKSSEPNKKINIKAINLIDWLLKIEIEIFNNFIFYYLIQSLCLD